MTGRMNGVTTRRRVLAAGVALLAGMIGFAAPGAGTHGGCGLEVDVDPEHAPAREWSSHEHPRFTWDAACGAFPDLEAFVVYPSWGPAFTTTNTSLHVPVDEGIHSVHVVAVWSRTDEGGLDLRSSRTVQSPEVGVDTTPPALDVVKVAGEHDSRGEDTALAPGTHVRPVFLDAMSGVATVQYRVPGGSWTDVPRDGVVAPQSGAGVLQFRAVDHAGNARTMSVPVAVDEDAPTGVLEAPRGVVHVEDGESVPVRAHVTDLGSGVERVRLLVEGEPVGTAFAPEGPHAEWEIDLEWDPARVLPHGTHAVEFEVVDAVGNAAVVDSFEVRVGEG